jgi:hypothetical protein
MLGTVLDGAVGHGPAIFHHTAFQSRPRPAASPSEDSSEVSIWNRDGEFTQDPGLRPHGFLDWSGCSNSLSSGDETSLALKGFSQYVAGVRSGCRKAPLNSRPRVSVIPSQATSHWRKRWATWASNSGPQPKNLRVFFGGRKKNPKPINPRKLLKSSTDPEMKKIDLQGLARRRITCGSTCRAAFAG